MKKTLIGALLAIAVSPAAYAQDPVTINQDPVTINQDPVTINWVIAHATDDRRVNIVANNASSRTKLCVWHCGGTLGPLCSTSSLVDPPANDNTAFMAPASNVDGVISGLRYQFRIAGCSDNAGTNCPEAANPIITEGASKPESPGWIMTTPDESVRTSERAVRYSQVPQTKRNTHDQRTNSPNQPPPNRSETR